MRRTPWSRVPILVVAALLTTSARAGAQAESMFPETVKDFGVVPRGPLLNHYFSIKNTTGQQMQIGNVRVSCGCVSAQATRTVLQPGQTGSIYATMDTRRFHGDKQVTIYVQTLRPTFSEYALQVKAHGRDDFQITPDTIAFGTVAHGEAATAKATVSFYGTADWSLTGAKCQSKFITPEIRKVKSTPYETTYEVTAQLRPDTPVGHWFTDVWVETQKSDVPRFRVPLSVKVTPLLSAQPASLRWESAKVGEAAEQQVVVRGDQPFKVLRVEGAGDSLDVTGIDEEAKPEHVLTLRYTPSREGVFRGVLKIVTDVRTQPELTVPAVVVAK